MGWPSRPNILVLAAAAPIVAILVLGDKGPWEALLAVIGLGLSFAACQAVLHEERTPAALWPAVAVMAFLAVLRAPIGSHDLWSYVSYGRMVSQHGANPYVTVPAAFPHDISHRLVGWRHTPSVYGPLFTLYSAALTKVAGNSLWVARLGFQLLAAGSVAWCLLALQRAGRYAALTLVALQPFVWVSVVNEGHNDAVMAALLLAAVVAFSGEKVGRASALTALAAMVKFSALILVVPIVVFLVVRRRWRAAAVMAGWPVGVVLVGALVVPGTIENASRATADKISRAAVWHPLELVNVVPVESIAVVGTGVVVLLIALISWRRRMDADVGASAGASLSAFGMSAVYVLPWYVIWGLPILALSGDLALTAIVAARGSVLLASYELPGGSAVQAAAGLVVSGVVPIGLLVLFLWRVFRPDRAGVGTAPRPPAMQPGA